MRSLIIAITTFVMGAAANGAFAQSPIGEWRVKDGSAHIRVVNCGKALWGVVAWEKKVGHDIHNPNKALRNRPTLGLPILLHMQPTDKPGHWEGQIYNAEDGRTYDGSISLRSANVLHIEGCALAIFCGGEDWRRAGQGATSKMTAAQVCSGIAGGAGRTH